jgi:hypothetical protein
MRRAFHWPLATVLNYSCQIQTIAFAYFDELLQELNRASSESINYLQYRLLNINIKYRMRGNPFNMSKIRAHEFHKSIENIRPNILEIAPLGDNTAW